MKEPTLGNPQNTIAVLQKYNFTFQKKFGQNFLIDTHVLDKIIRSAEISKDDMVLEIGPGIGTMTQYLSLIHIWRGGYCKDRREENLYCESKPDSDSRN